MLKHLLTALLLAAVTGCASTTTAQPEKTTKQLIAEDDTATQQTFAMTPEEQKAIEAKQCVTGKHSIWVNTDSKEAIASITKQKAKLCWVDVATLGEVKTEESGPVYGYQVEASSDKEAQKLVQAFVEKGVEAQVRSGVKKPQG